MKDDYDRRYESVNFNCNLVRSLKWSYFGVGVNDFAEKAIIEHLLSCPKCRKEYEEYAKKVGWGKFDIEDIANKYKNKITELGKPKEAWITKYNNKEVIRLAASKAVREVMMSVKDRKFGEFLIKKICQRLDHLELCYSKEIELNEKSK